MEQQAGGSIEKRYKIPGLVLLISAERGRAGCSCAVCGKVTGVFVRLYTHGYCILTQNDRTPHGHVNVAILDLHIRSAFALFSTLFAIIRVIPVVLASGSEDTTRSTVTPPASLNKSGPVQRQLRQGTKLTGALIFFGYIDIIGRQDDCTFILSQQELELCSISPFEGRLIVDRFRGQIQTTSYQIFT